MPFPSGAAGEPSWLVVAVGTHSRASIQALGAHCRYFGYDFFVARHGEKWGGFQMKLEAQRTVARAVKPETMLVFVDAYDVVANNTLDELKKRYAHVAKNGEIVVQQDAECNPDNSYEPALRMKMPGEPYPFINAGIVIGPARTFLEVFEAKPFDGYSDDQVYWIETFLSLPGERIKIDTERLLTIMYRRSKYTWRDLSDGTRVMIDDRGNQPCFVHLAGDDKYHLPKTLKMTRREGTPGRYKYPVLEGFIALVALFFVFLVLFLVFVTLWSRERRICARR